MAKIRAMHLSLVAEGPTERRAARRPKKGLVRASKFRVVEREQPKAAHAESTQDAFDAAEISWDIPAPWLDREDDERFLRELEEDAAKDDSLLPALRAARLLHRLDG